MLLVVLHDVSFLGSIQYLLFQIQFFWDIWFSANIPKIPPKILKTDKNYNFGINYIKIFSMS